MTEGVRGRRSRALLWAGLGVATAVSGAVAAERVLVRRARSRPDPMQDEPLAERPGTEQRVMSFDGTELAVNVVGPATAPKGPDRPTLVFAHAFTLDMTAWHFQWKELSKAYRCVLFDHRGHGRSGPAGPGGYSVQAIGRDLKAVLDSTVPEGPAFVLGHSMGGMSIVSLADQFPEEFGARISGVVLANTAAADILKAIVSNLGARAGTALLPLVRRMTANTGRGYRVRRRFFQGQADLAFLVAALSNFGSNAPPSIINHVVRLSAQAPMEVWGDLITSMFEMDLGDALESIKVPALVVVGDVDRLTPPTSAVALKRRLPDARMVLFRDVGHCAMLEHPVEFNRVVDEFLSEVLAPDGVIVPP
jgi:pimeloyl-ACP methyl ester carboxylesterase